MYHKYHRAAISHTLVEWLKSMPYDYWYDDDSVSVD